MLKNNDSLTLWDYISLDAIQKGHRIDETVAQDMTQRGLIGRVSKLHHISWDRQSHQTAPGIYESKGLDKARLRQMVLHYYKMQEKMVLDEK